MPNSSLGTLLNYTLWNKMLDEDEFTSDEEDKLSLSDDDESTEDLMMLTVMNEMLCEDKFTSDEEDKLFSSSDDDSTYATNAALISAIAQKRSLRPRRGLLRNRDYVDNYFLNQSDSDFRMITRVDRDTFFHILSLIENDGVFQNDHKGPQHPIHWQLACVLDTLGNDGQGVSHAHSKLIRRIGQGTIHLYTKRVVRALCNLKRQYIRWPSVVERQQIALRMAEKGFQGAVGVVGGTTIPLHKKPSISGNVDRKKTYPVNAQVVCDDMSRIIFFITGHPGSSGDLQVFNSSSLAMTPERAFSANEYLLADCGYAPTPTVVPAYKKNQRDCRLDGDEPNKIERFNNFLAKARVINERTIGILKNRWSSLQRVRIDLQKREDMRTFVEQAVACVVLHNLCLTIDPWDEWDDEFLDTADSANVNNDSERAMQECALTPSERALQESVLTPSERAMQESALTPGQKKRWAVRNACLAFHDRQAS